MKTIAQSTLRPYQARAVSESLAWLKAGRAVLVVSPTGAGKTRIAASIARRFKRVLFVAHRQEIINQAKDAMGSHVVVMSILSALRYGPKSVDLLIIDEAHRSAADTYRKLIEKYSGAYRLGLTATPLRVDGQGLCDAFDEMVIASSIPELIRAGHLVPYRALEAPDEALQELARIKKCGGDYAPTELGELMSAPRLIGDVVREYLKHGTGRKAVVFAVNVKHSIKLAEAFRSAGVRSAHIDGRASRALRSESLRYLADGKIDVLCNVNLFTEGWDCPAVSCVVMARPTCSTTLYLQSVGRGMRPYPGKPDLLILDHAGNIARHGYPDDLREWSLESAEARENREAEVAELERMLALGFNSIEEYELEQKRIREVYYSPQVADEILSQIADRTFYLIKRFQIPRVKLHGGGRGFYYEKTAVDDAINDYKESYSAGECGRLFGMRSVALTFKRLGVRSVLGNRYLKEDVDSILEKMRAGITSKEVARDRKVWQCNATALLKRHMVPVLVRVKNTVYYDRAAVQRIPLRAACES